MSYFNAITTISEVERIKQNSNEKPQIIFKHSTRCSLSAIAKKRVEEAFEKLSPYCSLHIVDILKHRPVSDFIANVFDAPHQSPQLLILKNEECVLEQSHLAINPQEVLEFLATAVSKDIKGNNESR
jgi:bacillithiol system protein YtxJ